MDRNEEEYITMRRRWGGQYQSTETATNKSHDVETSARTEKRRKIHDEMNKRTLTSSSSFSSSSSVLPASTLSGRAAFLATSATATFTAASTLRTATSVCWDRFAQVSTFVASSSMRAAVSFVRAHKAARSTRKLAVDARTAFSITFEALVADGPRLATAVSPAAVVSGDDVDSGYSTVGEGMLRLGLHVRGRVGAGD